MGDHCTGWPEGTWAGCCKLHDLAYANPLVPKLTADIDLVQCVAATGGWPMALLMGAGVTLFGLPFLIRARRKR